MLWSGLKRLCLKKPRTCNRNDHLMKALEQFLRQHLAHTKQSFASAKGFRAMELRWDKLLRSDSLTFATNAINQSLTEAARNDSHAYQTHEFRDIYVAVSTVPKVDPSEARAYFEGGYLHFVDILLEDSGYRAGDSDLAHWVFCCDGMRQAIHLTFIPAKGMIENQGSDTILLFAQDLMTSAEKSRAHIFSG